MIRLNHFVKLFKLVTKHAKKQIQSVKKQHSAKRREYLSRGEDAAYAQCVSEQMQDEEKIYQDVATFAMDTLGIDEQIFMMSQQMHMQNPMF